MLEDLIQYKSWDVLVITPLTNLSLATLMQLLFPKSTTQTLSELKHQLNWNNVILTCTLIIYISTTLSEEERDFFFLKQPCPTGHTDCARRRKAEQEKKKIMCTCMWVLPGYVWRACHRQCVVPIWGWGSAQWSTAVPTNCVPRCHHGTMMVTVIGDCVLHSSLPPPSFPSLAPVLHFYLASLTAPGF